MKPEVKNVDDYIAQFDPPIKNLLAEIRQTIMSAAPKAVETISYRMPAYKLNGKPLAYFAAFTNHIGFYPTAGPLAKLAKEVEEYQHSKGAVQFPLYKPLPIKLIIKLIQSRAAQIDQQPTGRSVNALWHRANRMPKNATLAQKINWHEGHAKHCNCRDSKQHLVKLKAQLNERNGRR